MKGFKNQNKTKYNGKNNSIIHHNSFTDHIIYNVEYKPSK